MLFYTPSAVKVKAIGQSDFFKSVLGAVMAVLCGFMLWQMPLGEPWVNASYDNLFRFGARAVTNRVTLILMDNDSSKEFHQTPGQPWDRSLHAELLNKLAADGCSLAVFDVIFQEPRRDDPANDAALADAMRRQHRVVLAAGQVRLTRSRFRRRNCFSARWERIGALPGWIQTRT